jgi:hypothetical protein
VIPQASEALPLSIVENATRARLTKGRVLPVPSCRAVGLYHTGTATGAAPMAPRVFRVIRLPGALIALAVIAMSLSSCAATNRNAFLGPAYDGPTAAYRYNMP